MGFPARQLTPTAPRTALTHATDWPEAPRGLRLVSLQLSNVYNGVFREEPPLEQQARQHGARQRLGKVVDGLSAVNRVPSCR